MEAYVLRQEVQFLRTLLCDRLLSLGELFEEELSDLLQRVDTGMGMGTPCDILSKLDATAKKDAMSHIGVIDASSIVREGYTRHGLYLNSRGKERLAHLIAERVVDGHVSSISSIPFITNARASPFLG
jgi:hypothetical protein